MSRNLPSFEVKKLSTIMNELGHKWVDVLKVPLSLASCADFRCFDGRQQRL